MRDEIFDRDYQAGREAFNDGIDHVIASISQFVATTGRAIHAFEFDAPWQRVPPAKLAKSAKAARRARAA